MFSHNIIFTVKITLLLLLLLLLQNRPRCRNLITRTLTFLFFLLLIQVPSRLLLQQLKLHLTFQLIIHCQYCHQIHIKIPLHILVTPQLYCKQQHCSYLLYLDEFSLYTHCYALDKFYVCNLAVGEFIVVCVKAFLLHEFQYLIDLDTCFDKKFDLTCVLDYEG